MDPARQQQPALTLHHMAHHTPFAPELRAPHFIDGLVCVLHNVELVVDDGTIRCPLAQAGRVRLPHVHASRLDAPSWTKAQLATEELVQGFFLTFQAKPERLSVSKLL